MFRIFELTSQKISADLVKSLTHPDDKEFWKNSVNESLYNGKPFHLDYRILRPDASVRWIHNEAEVVRDEKGNPVKMVGTAQHLKEKKLAKQEIRHAMLLLEKVYLSTEEASDIEEPLDENRLNGSETILVAEDSKTLLKLTQKMLESYGYNVLTAQSGNETMEILNRHDGPIHLLLTDMVMPGMSDRELAEKIQSKNLEIHVIYMSGYTDDTIFKHQVLDEDIEFIEKPFSKKDLGLKVCEVLTQK